MSLRIYDIKYKVWFKSGCNISYHDTLSAVDVERAIELTKVAAKDEHFTEDLCEPQFDRVEVIDVSHANTLTR